MANTNGDEQKFPYLWFTSVNRRVNPFTMKDDELLDLVNWYSDKIGSKTVRPGLTPFLDQIDGNAVKHLYYAKFPNGNKRLLRFSGSKIYAVDPTTANTWGSSIFTNSGNFTNPESVILAAKIHTVDQDGSGVGKYFEYNSSTVTETTYTSSSDVVIPHKGSTITVLHRRIYVGKPYYSPNTYRSRLSWSSIDYVNKGTTPATAWTTDANDVSSSNFRDIDIDYKGNILKLTNINDSINIYKENGIYRYNESLVYLLFGASPFAGSIATMEEVNEDFFFTNEGFYRTTGRTVAYNSTISVKPVAEGWLPIIKQILHNGIDTTKVTSFAANYQYFCYMGDVTYDGNTVRNACFVYDARLDEMWLWSFAYDISCFGSYTNTSGDKVILLGDVNGNVYKLDYYANDDAGQPIQAYFIHKYLYFDNPVLFKNQTELYMFSTPGVELELLFDKDYKNQYESVGTISGYASSKRLGYDKIGQFQALSAKILWNGKGVRPTFNGYISNIKFGSERIT